MGHCVYDEATTDLVNPAELEITTQIFFIESLQPWIDEGREQRGSHLFDHLGTSLFGVALRRKSRQSKTVFRVISMNRELGQVLDR